MSRNSRPESPENKRGPDSKRGISLAHEGQKTKLQKPSALPYLDMSLQGAKQSIDSLKQLKDSLPAVQKFSYNQYVFPGGEPTHVQHTNPQTYMNQQAYTRQQGEQFSHMSQERRSTTPTKVHFNYMGQQQPSVAHPLHYAPAGLHQQVEVRKTVVPVHYFNQIPARIVVPQPQPQQPQMDSQNLEDFITNYEKMYNSYMDNEQRVQDMTAEIEHLNAVVAELSQEHKQARQTTVQTKVRLNVSEMEAHLSRLYRETLEKVVNKRKRSCQNRIQDLINNAQNQLVSSTSTLETGAHRVRLI